MASPRFPALAASPAPSAPRRGGARLGLVARTALAPALWGGTYALFTETLPTSHPLSVAAGRSLVGGLLLLAWVRSRRTALGRAPSTALAAPRSADLAAR